MKKLFSIVCLFSILQTSYSQTDASKIVLGIPTLVRSQTISEENANELTGVIQDQAGKIQGLATVPRTSAALKAISDEISKQQDPSSLNSSVLADADKQLGATYLMVGTLSKVDLTKQFWKYKIVLGAQVPMYFKFVNVQISISILNVSTGQPDTTAQISSDNTPVEVIGGDSRTISAAFTLMAPKFRAFIQNWYNNKIGVVRTNTKTN